MKDNLGDRMKRNYESVWRQSLPWRMPVVVRLDGKSFHTFTRGMARPFDAEFVERMIATAAYVCEETATAQVAYIQSDEISVFLHPYQSLESQPYFDNQVQKLVSVMAGQASAFLSLAYGRPAVFDGRAFVVPESELNNYFLWRQQDASRNSLQMLAQSLYSHKELHGKASPALHELCFQKGRNWNELPTHLRRGACLHRVTENQGTDAEPVIRSRWDADMDIPLFTQEPTYIGQFLRSPESIIP
jgi:tRNA(His) guanylyltransferase